MQVDGEESTGAGSSMRRRCRWPTLAAVMPVAARLTFERCGFRPNSGQSSRGAAAAACACLGAGILVDDAVGGALTPAGGAPELPQAFISTQTPTARARRERRLKSMLKRRVRVVLSHRAVSWPLAFELSKLEGGSSMARTPQVGEQAPDFELPGTDGPFKLSEHRGERVVLLFYPGDNTLVSPGSSAPTAIARRTSRRCRPPWWASPPRIWSPTNVLRQARPQCAAVGRCGQAGGQDLQRFRAASRRDQAW